MRVKILGLALSFTLLRCLPASSSVSGPLEIFSPPNQKVVSENSVPISGAVRCEGGVEKFSVGEQQLSPQERETHFSVSVSLTSGVNTIPVKVECADGTGAAQDVTVIYDNLPPRIILERTPPQPDGGTGGEKFVLNAKVIEEHGRLFSVAVDGRELPVYADSKNLLISEEIALKPGKNLIRIAATDALGNRSSETVTVVSAAAPSEPDLIIGEEFPEAVEEVQTAGQTTDDAPPAQSAIGLNVSNDSAGPLRGVEVADGALYAPVRELLYHFDFTATVKRNTVRISSKDAEVSFRIGEGEKPLHGAAFYHAGGIRIPLRETLEKLGYVVAWNGENRSITVNENLPAAALAEESEKTAAGGGVTREEFMPAGHERKSAAGSPSLPLSEAAIIMLAGAGVLLFAFLSQKSAPVRRPRYLKRYLPDARGDSAGARCERDEKRENEFVTRAEELRTGNEDTWRKIFEDVTHAANGNGNSTAFEAFKREISQVGEGGSDSPFVAVQSVLDAGYMRIRILDYRVRGKYREIRRERDVWLSPAGEYICTKSSGNGDSGCDFSGGVAPWNMPLAGKVDG